MLPGLFLLALVGIDGNLNLIVPVDIISHYLLLQDIGLTFNFFFVYYNWNQIIESMLYYLHFILIIAWTFFFNLGR